MEEEKIKTEKKEHKIDITLDEIRYNNLLELCNKYGSQQGTELTPKEYILMLIDSAMSSTQGLKGE